MIEELFPEKELAVFKPPRIHFDKAISFKGNNPFGIGQQAVHNAGSSMLKDTPTFAVDVLAFINDHFKYSSTETTKINSFISIQVKNLNKFKNNLSFRKSILAELFPQQAFEFNDNISSDFLYISLILFFVKKYNFLKSVQKAHSYTKQICKKYYSNEQELLSKYYKKLISINKIRYLSDICYGRYYFLEFHFSKKKNPRNVPRDIVMEYLLIENKNAEAFDLLEQKEVQIAKPITENLLDELGNRKPKIQKTKQGKRYRTDPRISKTVLEKAGFKCQINASHRTFYTTKNVPFSESHHLIPTCFQDKFLPINLDRKENIVSLCPNCHRAVHLGNIKEKECRLKALFKIKHKELNKVGLKIELKDLIKLYI